MIIPLEEAPRVVELDPVGLLGVAAWLVSDDIRYLKDRLVAAYFGQDMRTGCKAKNKRV